ncbi:MAG TPA: Na/Pi cotransporter family protein [Sediminispirochaeta sp.]|nr:Na/Pi cotransporter family protein [Sediminispirochaeta sp.]
MIVRLLEIFGSLGLFLYGMRTMSDGIQKAAGERLQTILGYMTGNRFAGVLTGFGTTALIQSSSATTVMVVSFVNAGLLSLSQAIGVIMGANIGTTVTGWIVALFGFKFDITAVALPAIGIGLPLIFWKRLRKTEWGEALIGFGLLFLGLSFLKSLVPDIDAHPESLEFVKTLTGYGLFSRLLFILIGTTLTVILQSSSASMAITLTMAFSGWIDFPNAVAMVLGENIGTTVTAVLASVGADIHARRAAAAHMLFNILGIVWVQFLFFPIIALVDSIVPGSYTTSAGITAHLAMFHTTFNVLNTTVFLPFVNWIEALVKFIVPVREEGEETRRYQLSFFSGSIQETPELNLLRAKTEIIKMTQIVQDMYHSFLYVFHHPEKKLKEEVAELQEQEELTDQMQEELSKFLAQCAMENLKEKSAENVSYMMRIVHELESVGDSCFNLLLLSKRRYDKDLHISDEALQDLEPYLATVDQYLSFVTTHTNRHLSSDEMAQAVALEEKVDQYRNTLQKAARRRIKLGSDVKAELLYIDIVRHIEKIGDHLLNIAQALRQIR